MDGALPGTVHTSALDEVVILDQAVARVLEHSVTKLRGRRSPRVAILGGEMPYWSSPSLSRSGLLMESAVCIVCGVDDSETTFIGRDRQHGSYYSGLGQ